jgi:hypothetical protein
MNRQQQWESCIYRRRIGRRKWEIDTSNIHDKNDMTRKNNVQLSRINDMMHGDLLLPLYLNKTNHSLTTISPATPQEH